MRGVILTGNTFWKSYAHDLHIEKSTHILLGPNMFHNNPAYRAEDSLDVILIEDNTDCQLTGIHVTRTFAPEAAIVLRRCKRFNMTNCSVLDCANGGLLLDDVHDSRVSGCIIRHDLKDRGDFVPQAAGDSLPRAIQVRFYSGHVGADNRATRLLLLPAGLEHL